MAEQQANSDAEDARQPFQFLFIEPEVRKRKNDPSFDITQLVAQVCGPAQRTALRDKILVLHTTPWRDVHADELVAELALRGAPVVYLHLHDMLKDGQVAVQLEPENGVLGRLELPSGQIALEEVQSVWCRGSLWPLTIAIPPQDDERAFAERESRAALEAMLSLLQHALWVNHPHTVAVADEKMRQLQLARSLGFRIPRTLLTNDPAQARTFFDACGGDVIVKTFHRRAGYADGGERVILCNRVRPEHLDQIARVRHVPCFFQEYVPKDVELRVTIVGHQIFAAEIHSQRSPISRDDYRRYDLANTPYYPVTLPPSLAEACLRLMDAYELSFAALDLIRRPDGAYVFLEINANAQFLWIQDLTGLPIRQALANLLIEGVQHR